MNGVIRRCAGNGQTWVLDTGTCVAGPTALSLDRMVQIIAGQQTPDTGGPVRLTIEIDRAKEHAAARAEVKRRLGIAEHDLRVSQADVKRLRKLLEPKP